MINKDNVIDSLISMNGVNTIDFPLSLFGAFLFLLGAVASKSGDCFPDSVNYKIDIDNNNIFRSSEGILPNQGDNLRKTTIDAMFTMFLRLIWDEHPTENPRGLVLREVVVNDQYLELKLDFDPAVARVGRTQSLKERIGQCLYENNYGKDRDEGTSMAIVKYWKYSNSCNVKQSNEKEWFFPYSSQIKIKRENRQTVLRIAKTKSEVKF